MTSALALFALVIMALSLYGVLFPGPLTTLVIAVMQRPAGMVVAVVARLLLAIMLWLVAPQSRMPLVFQVLALLALSAALVLPFIGRERILRLLRSVAAWPGGALRVGCMAGVVLGGFVFWALYPTVMPG